MKNKIRAFRLQKGLTLEEVGKLSGMSHVQVGRLEKGDRQLKPKQIGAIADALGVSWQSLLELDPIEVVGTVGAEGVSRHAVVIPLEPSERVPCPNGFDPRVTRAVRIGSKIFEPGIGLDWLAFFHPAFGVGVPAELVGKLCISRLAGSGETIIGNLTLAPEQGRYNVLGLGMPMLENQTVLWAAPILGYSSPFAAPLDPNEPSKSTFNYLHEPPPLES